MLKIKNKIPSALTIGGKVVDRIKINNEVVWENVQTDYFYIESLGDGNTISVVNKGDGSTSDVTHTLEYSKDKNTWNTITFDWTSGTHTTELPVKLNTGEKMYFRNNTGKFSNSYNKYITFSSSVSSNVGGDIRTLSNYLDVNNETTPKLNMFCNLFYNNKYIVNASNLRLPYTRLIWSCYGGMFQGCTSLTTAPTELPATTLGQYCYSGMFRHCSSLTTSPELPATTLVSNCYYGMFQNCTSLNNVTVYADDISASNCTNNWLSGVASSGTFHNLGSATYPTGPSGIPSGWTEVKN